MLADHQGREIGFGEVAVVVRLFLAAHGKRAALGVVPKPRLLHNTATLFQNTALPFDLVFEGGANVAEAVDVLYLRLGAEF